MTRPTSLTCTCGVRVTIAPRGIIPEACPTCTKRRQERDRVGARAYRRRAALLASRPTKCACGRTIPPPVVAEGVPLRIHDRCVVCRQEAARAVQRKAVAKYAKTHKRPSRKPRQTEVPCRCGCGRTVTPPAKVHADCKAQVAAAKVKRASERSAGQYRGPAMPRPSRPESVRTSELREAIRRDKIEHPRNRRVEAFGRPEGVRGGSTPPKPAQEATRCQEQAVAPAPLPPDPVLSPVVTFAEAVRLVRLTSCETRYLIRVGRLVACEGGYTRASAMDCRRWHWSRPFTGPQSVTSAATERLKPMETAYVLGSWLDV